MADSKDRQPSRLERCTVPESRGRSVLAQQNRPWLVPDQFTWSPKLGTEPQKAARAVPQIPALSHAIAPIIPGSQSSEKKKSSSAWPGRERRRRPAPLGPTLTDTE
ncbi:uncharacterized protein FOMMEDRAFT_155919 [Fomitiporia mediterranea MF3/22]|uniref:uncharacterized protein n=1 Tax=Fomitiporia mediterranea (strain MF3/22) TaxID=694068 RepID=UPI0004408D00|nr:uncharacterized protein FOMMEDRAFT_155919 [Fomitiporia mediterranea MF3/22]EJD02601.1 hypothetical protein FOMMEDRAFT_155919 [Fomitiporia mediterranea MF3/22]